MSGLGKGNSSVHRFGVTNLSDEYDVRRLTKRVLQGDLVILGVHPDLTLRDDGLLMRVNEFDRIFDGDNVAGRIGVAIVNHGSKCGRLTAASSSDDEDQP